MAITLVQSASGTGDLSPRSATLGSTPTQGNLLTTVNFHRDLGGGALSYTEPSGYAVDVDTANTLGDTDQIVAVIASKTAGASEGTVVSWSWGSGGRGNVWVAEWSGFSSPSVDQVAEAGSGTSAVSSQTTGTTGTTTEATELALAAVAINRSSDTTFNAWTNSFTQQAKIHGNSSSNGGNCAIATKILSATGTVETTADTAPNSQLMAGAIATYKGAGVPPLNVSGSITPTGTLAKQANKAAAGSITPSAALVKAVSMALSASIAPSGSIAKQANKALAGSVTPSGVLSTIKVALLSLAGAITPSGVLAKLVGKSTAGAITPAGSLAKAITKAIAGSLAPAGALAKAITKAIAGTLAPAGSLTNEEIVEGPAITVTYRDSGHTGTYKDDGHTGTYRSSGHTGTYREGR